MNEGRKPGNQGSDKGRNKGRKIRKENMERIGEDGEERRKGGGTERDRGDERKQCVAQKGSGRNPSCRATILHVHDGQMRACGGITHS